MVEDGGKECGSSLHPSRSHTVSPYVLYTLQVYFSVISGAMTLRRNEVLTMTTWVFRVQAQALESSGALLVEWLSLLAVTLGLSGEEEDRRVLDAP